MLYRFGDRVYDTWPFVDSADKQAGKNSDKYTVKVSGNRLSNDADVVHRWVVAGKGITMKSRLDMAADLRSGHVVEILNDFYSPAINLWLICPNRTQVTPAMLMLRDLLRSKCEAELR